MSRSAHRSSRITSRVVSPCWSSQLFFEKYWLLVDLQKLLVQWICRCFLYLRTVCLHHIQGVHQGMAVDLLFPEAAAILQICSLSSIKVSLPFLSLIKSLPGFFQVPAYLAEIVGSEGMKLRPLFFAVWFSLCINKFHRTIFPPFPPHSRSRS